MLTVFACLQGVNDPHQEHIGEAWLEYYRWVDSKQFIRPQAVCSHYNPHQQPQDDGSVVLVGEARDHRGREQTDGYKLYPQRYVYVKKRLHIWEFILREPHDSEHRV